MKVKTWQPAPGCAQCKQAEQLFDSHTKMRMAGHAIELRKIRELASENERLRIDAERYRKFRTLNAVDWDALFSRVRPVEVNEQPDVAVLLDLVLDAALRGEGE